MQLRFYQKLKQLKKLMRKAIYGLLVCVFVSIACVLIFKQRLVEESTTRLAHHLDLVVKSVKIFTDSEVCSSATKIIRKDALRGMPIYNVPIAELKKALEDVDCAKNVHVVRRWPSTIQINIYAKKPIAIWQNGGRFRYITEDGSTMGITALPESGIEHLISVLGKDAPQHTPYLLNLLSIDKKLSMQVEHAVWIGDRRWNLYFANGTIVKLPEKNMEIAWEKLSRLVNEISAFKEWKYKSIDLRIEGKVFAK